MTTPPPIFDPSKRPVLPPQKRYIGGASNVGKIGYQKSLQNMSDIQFQSQDASIARYAPLIATWKTNLNYENQTANVIAKRQLGYLPTYWEDPRQVARYYNAITSLPKDAPFPDWLDKGAVTTAYEWFKYRNGDTPWQEWKFLPDDDPARSFLQELDPPPQNLLLPNDKWYQQKPFVYNDQVATPEAADLKPGDPGFDWNSVDHWQKFAYYLTSNPYTAPLIQMGGLLAATTLVTGEAPNPATAVTVGLILAAAWAAQQKNPTLQAIGLGAMKGLNWLALQAEKTAGLGEQLFGRYVHNADVYEEVQKEVMAQNWNNPLYSLSRPAGFGTKEERELIEYYREKVNNLYNQRMIEKNKLVDLEMAKAGGLLPWSEAAFIAGEVTYEESAKHMPGNLFARIEQTWDKITKQSHPMKFAESGQVWQLGTAEPVDLPQGYSLEDARKRILKGDTPDEVLMDFQKVYGMSGLNRDMILSSVFDPLNLVPKVTGIVGSEIADVAGKPVIAEAFRQKGPFWESMALAKEMYRTGAGGLSSELTGLDRFIARVTPEGLPMEMINKKPGVFNFLTSLTPDAKARLTMVSMLNNFKNMMDMSGDNIPMTFDLFKAWAKQDVVKLKDMGATFLGAPEAYMSVPAIRDFVDKFGEQIINWETTKTNRDGLLQLSKILGESPSDIIRSAADNPENFFTRLVKKATDSNDPKAKAFLDQIKKGVVTPDGVNELLQPFVENHASYHPQEFKATVMGLLYEHAANWAVDFFKIKPDNIIFQSAALLKNVQSMLLLSMNPAYAVNNLLNGEVTRAAVGAFGYLPPWKIDEFFKRWGYDPTSLRRGAGPAFDIRSDYQGGKGEMLKGERVLREATRGKGMVADMRDGTRTMIEKVGVFSNMSKKVEQWQSAQTTTIAMKKFWRRYWKKGVGYGAMPPNLEAALNQINPDLVDNVYMAIGAGMNWSEVEASLAEGALNRNVEMYASRAAADANIDPTEALDLLSQAGILDDLRTKLANATSQEDIRRAFDSVENKADEWLRATQAQDLVQMADVMSEKVKAEGFPGAVSVFDRMVADALYDKFNNDREWDETYRQVEQVWEDKGLRRRLVEQQATRSEERWNRRFVQDEATWLGILKAWGFEDENASAYLAGVTDWHKLERDYFKLKSEEWRKFYKTEFKNRQERSAAVYTLIDEQNKRWLSTQANVTAIQKKIDLILEGIMEKQLGPGRGAGVRVWREGIRNMTDTMTQEMVAFRDSINGLTSDEQSRMWNEYKPVYYQKWRDRAITDLTATGRIFKDQTEVVTFDNALKQTNMESVADARDFGIYNAARQAGFPLYENVPEVTPDVGRSRILGLVQEYGGEEGAAIKMFTDEKLTLDLVVKAVNKWRNFDPELVTKRIALHDTALKAGYDKFTGNPEELTYLVRQYGPPEARTLRNIDDLTPDMVQKAVDNWKAIRQQPIVQTLPNSEYIDKLTSEVAAKRVTKQSLDEIMKKSPIEWDAIEKEAVQVGYNYNHLTGIGSKEAWVGRVSSGGGKPISIAIDIDYLKWFNDHGGHPVGDQLLQAYANIIKEVVGDDGYHFGGDEYGIMFDTQEAADVAMQRIQEIADTVQIEFQAVDPNTSAPMLDGEGRPIVTSVKGLRYTYGTGTDLTKADTNLVARKAQRPDTRGLEPASTIRRTASESWKPSIQRLGQDQLFVREKERIAIDRQTILDIHSKELHENPLKQVSPELRDPIIGILGSMKNEAGEPLKSLVQKIKEWGGIDIQHISDVGLERKNQRDWGPGLFVRKGGYALDQLAVKMSEEGFIHEGLTDPNALDSVTNLITDMIQDELAGRKKYYSFLETEGGIPGEHQITELQDWYKELPITGKNKRGQAEKIIDQIIESKDNLAYGVPETAAERRIRDEAFQRLADNAKTDVDLAKSLRLSEFYDYDNWRKGIENIAGDIEFEIEKAMQGLRDPAETYKELSGDKFNELLYKSGELPTDAPELHLKYGTDIVNRIGLALDKLDNLAKIKTAEQNYKVDVAAEIKAGELIMNRKVFEEQLIQNSDLTPDQVDVTVKMLDAYAQDWAARNNSTPDQWYEQFIEELSREEKWSGNAGDFLQELPVREALQYRLDGLRKILETNYPDLLPLAEMNSIIPNHLKGYSIADEFKQTQAEIKFYDKTGKEMTFRNFREYNNSNVPKTVYKSWKKEFVPKDKPFYTKADIAKRKANLLAEARETNTVGLLHRLGLLDESDPLFQIEPISRRMTPDEISNYTRAMVRSGVDELRRAVQNEANPADRVAILDAAHKIDPKMAEDVARKTTTLYQEDNYASVWYSKLERTITDKMPNRIDAAALRGLLNGAGVKADEMKWTGFDDFLEKHKGAVTKEEVLQFVRENQVEIREVQKGWSDSGSGRIEELPNGKYNVEYPSLQTKTFNTVVEAVDYLEATQKRMGTSLTKFASYVEPGGENYREVLLALPAKETPAYYIAYKNGPTLGSPYKTEAEALAAMMDVMPNKADQMEIRIGEKGRETITVADFKSPHWNEPNVLAHFRLDDRIDAAGKRVLFIEEIQSDWHQAGRERGYYKQIDRLPSEAKVQPYKSDTFSGYAVYDPNWYKGRTAVSFGETEAIAIANALQEYNRSEGYKVPAAPFAKTWPDLSMKRIIRMAAEEGYDKVAWTTGDMQAARYDLAKTFDQIIYIKEQYTPNAYELRGVRKGSSDPVLLESKVPAERLSEYVGQDLADKIIAGEGQQIAHTPMKKFTGVDLKVGGEGMKGFYDTILPETVQKYVKKWGGKVGETFITERGLDLTKGVGAGLTKDMVNGMSVHSFDITDSMKQSVLHEGQPLFQGAKGAVSFLENGKAIIRLFDKHDFSTIVHEAGHIFRRGLDANDMKTIEDWAGVKDGVWKKTHEEKYARAFERYVAEGIAPTTALADIFRRAKEWMLEIYRAIKGSSIDVDLTDEVRDVFDRMLGKKDAWRETRGWEMTAEEWNYNGPTPEAEAAWAASDEFIEAQKLYKKAEKLTQTNMTPDDRKRGAALELGSDAIASNWAEDNMNHEVIVEKALAAGLTVPAEVLKDYPELQKKYVGIEAERKTIYAQDPLEIEYKKLSNEFSSYQFDRDDPKMQRLIELEKYINQKKTLPKGVYSVGDIVRLTKENVNATIAEVRGNGTLKLEDGRVVSVLEVERVAAQDNMFEALGVKEPKPEAQQTTLFQDVPLLPPDGSDQISGAMPEGRMRFESFNDQLLPLMNGMRKYALAPDAGTAMPKLPPEIQKQFGRYMNETRGKMATAKATTTRWGENVRDQALLNYGRLYGADKFANIFIPYQLFASRTGFNWALRIMDRPAWAAMYSRWTQFRNRNEANLPERMRGKIKIPMSFLPEWAGGGVFVNPEQQLIPFTQYLQPMQAYMRDQTSMENNATYIIRDWVQNETVGQTEAQQALDNKSGAVWDKALAQAQLEAGADQNNTYDYFSMLFSPALYMSIPYYLITGKKMNSGSWPASPLPITRTGMALETAFKGTKLEWMGNALGLMAKPEAWARQAMGLSEFGDWGDYYIDRQMSNMAADGSASVDDVKRAMVERKGPVYDEALSRVQFELMAKVPGSLPIYGMMHGAQLDQVLGSIPPSLFSAGLLPAGELEYRGQKIEYNAAWEKYNHGDKQALNKFFDDHPEYETRLALRDDPADRMQQFLISEIWDRYMALGETNRKIARSALGQDFSTMFLDKENYAPDAIPVEKLAEWAKMLGGIVPDQPEERMKLGKEAPELTPLAPDVQPIQMAPEEITVVTDQYYSDRDVKFPGWYFLQSQFYNLPESTKMIEGATPKESAMIVAYRNARRQMFPNYYEIQTRYFALPEGERSTFLRNHPELGQYWDWNKQQKANNPIISKFVGAESYYVGPREDYLRRFPQLKQYWQWKNDMEARYPDLVGYFSGKIYKNVDMSTWNPVLVEQLSYYALANQKLSDGSLALLKQLWIQAGEPYGSFSAWLDADIVPSILNNGGYK